MEIVRLPIADIKPYERNAKVHTDTQILHIMNSIRAFGFNDPIGIWGENNVCVEGHGRLLALMRMGVTDVDCVRLDHLTDAERRAYTLAHNQTAIETGFDDDILDVELGELDLPDVDFDMGDFGFGDNNSGAGDAVLIVSELKPYKKVHYLVSCDINAHDGVVGVIDILKKMDGVEIESSLN